MAFSIEYANVFSSILAKENIFIKIDGSLSTAYFDLESRTLALPEWDGTRVLQRFLMCHEIAHCIFTPPDGWMEAIHAYPKEFQMAYKDVLNVFEDARIDRIMPEKYSTMRRWYYEGYKELVEKQDFFGLNANPKSLQNFDLISRINLWTKTHIIGNPYGVTFDAKEQVWIDRAMATRTWDEVRQLADDFFAEMDEEAKKRASLMLTITVYIPGGDGTEKEESEKKQKPFQRWVAMDNLLVGDDDYKKFVSTKISRLDDPHNFPFPAKSVITKMVTAFQRFKNARLYSKALTTKTGALDPLKLHSYSYNEDIMRRKTVIDKQKNHGFLVIVDMSQSMQGVWNSVINHLYIMAMFCKYSDIPFAAYGFEDREFECRVTNGMFRFVPLISTSDRPKKIMEKFIFYQNKPPKSGTPLTSAIHYAKTMTLDFQKTNHIDVMNVLFLTDGGCTQTVKAQTYTDKVSRLMLNECPNYIGHDDAVGPLTKILRHRTKANVWMFDIQSNMPNVPLMDYKEECGGSTGTFLIREDILANPNIFVSFFIDKMAEFGGKLDTNN